MGERKQTWLSLTNDYDGEEDVYFDDSPTGMVRATSMLKLEAERIRIKNHLYALSAMCPALFIHRVGVEMKMCQLHSDQDWEDNNSLNPIDSNDDVEEEEDGGDDEHEEKKEEKRKDETSTPAYPMPGVACACVMGRPCCVMHSMPFGGRSGIKDATTRTSAAKDGEPSNVDHITLADEGHDE